MSIYDSSEFKFKATSPIFYNLNPICFVTAKLRRCCNIIAINKKQNSGQLEIDRCFVLLNAI